MRALDRKIASLAQRIREEVEASGTTLTEVFGVGSILVARIVGIVGDVSRFPEQEGSLRLHRAGVARIEASSGEVARGTGSRCRATVASTRSHAHEIAVCQARSDPRGKAYYRKKLAEGKSCKEAMRCLKRRVSDVVFKALDADSVGTSLAVA